MNDKIETTAYLQVRRKRQGWRQGVVERVTMKKPDYPVSGCVVVKIQVLIPLAAFEPLTPSVVVDIPEELVQHPVEVMAQ